MKVKHKFVSAIPINQASRDRGEVTPHEWNEEHFLEGVEDFIRDGDGITWSFFNDDGAFYFRGDVALRQSDINPDFQINSFSSTSPSIQEVGATVLNPSFLAAYQYPPSSVSVTDDIGGSSSDVSSSPTNFSYIGSYTYTNTNDSVTFTLTANDGTGPVTRQSTITWLPRVFWGVGAPGQNSSAFINSLTNNVLSGTKNRTLNVNAAAGEKIYYAYPSHMGPATFTVNGFSGGFNGPVVVSVSNGFSTVQDYNLYESANSGLGVIDIVVS